MMRDLKQTVGGNVRRFRKGAALSVERLAERVGVSRQTIHNYETGKTLPDGKTLTRMAEMLGVTLDDLLRQASEVPSFRFRAHASFARKPQFAAQVSRMLESYAAVEQAAGVAPYAPESTPCHQLDEEERRRVEEVAAQFRHRLDLGDGPILNLFEAAETIGLKVLRKPLPIDDFFGLSAASADRGAFILVNSHQLSIERQLFTLAHEIGHLIFHRGEYAEGLIPDGSKDEEKAREEVANHFASHLLVPQSAFERKLEETKSLTRLKLYFRVSYKTILKRVAEMGGPGYGELFSKIANEYRRKKGSRLTKEIELEPQLQAEDFPENERLQRLVLEALAQGKVTELRAAEMLGKTISDLRAARRNAEEHVTL